MERGRPLTQPQQLLVPAGGRYTQIARSDRRSRLAAVIRLWSVESRRLAKADLGTFLRERLVYFRNLTFADIVEEIRVRRQRTDCGWQRTTRTKSRVNACLRMSRTGAPGCGFNRLFAVLENTHSVRTTFEILEPLGTLGTKRIHLFFYFVAETRLMCTAVLFRLRASCTSLQLQLDL